MRVIDLEFESLEEMPIARLFGAIGVYVLWHHNATERPTYIGEGEILKRLATHVDWLRSGVTGLAARLNRDDVPDADAKRRAEICEYMLLWVAEEINRWPTKNKHPGKGFRVDRVLDRHDLLRINVRGYDPFAPLAHDSFSRPKLRERKEISLRLDGAEAKLVRDWHRRP